ncbi:UNVERIFIED_CONTAM: hypothetical protein Scaly_2789800 [Sesamum calycinum]|uniref:MULE transposase domain-containing protein n=1 Tax=Sesamum calycinum TaxID=2727403 RepID=A0AAW2IWQ4_9LAMI
MQLYRAKKKALEQIDGSYGDSYSKLPHYAEMVKRSNHGIIVKLQYNHGENDEDGDLVSSIPIVPSFKRIFVGLDALKKGFLQGCSPFMGFDGCHLKGPYGGVLLAAISLDGNNGLFPLAFVVVKSECKDSWCFFFQGLDDMLGGFDVDRPWTFMSDRQKGLLECINDMVPYAINRWCAKHLFANFKQHFSGMLLKKYFWQACRSYNEQGFNSAMEKIQEFKPAAAEWLMKIDVSMWARYAFPVD